MDRSFGLEIPKSVEEACRPDRTALLVYDMQVGIVSQLATGRAITEKVRQVLLAAREGGFRVFFTRHLSLPNEVAGVGQLRRAKAWQRAERAIDTRPAFLRDSPAFAIVPELAPLASEAIIDKITMSAFHGTYLDMALRDCGLGSFAIAGIALEIGIEPTAQHAADLGYLPVVVTDACGFGDAPAAERALAQMAYVGDVFLTESEKIIELFRSARSRVS